MRSGCGAGEANACQQVSACDDGNGYVNSAVDGCCEECAVRTYESCVGKNISILSDFCGVNKPGNAECCARATAEQTSCEAGVKVDCGPTTAHSTEPTTGAGGSTAAGTGSSAATAAAPVAVAERSPLGVPRTMRCTDRLRRERRLRKHGAELIAVLLGLGAISGCETLRPNGAACIKSLDCESDCARRGRANVRHVALSPSRLPPPRLLRVAV